MTKKDTLLNIVKRQSGCDDLLIGIVEEFQTISPVFAEPRWEQVTGVKGLQLIVCDIPITGDDNVDACKIASAAKLIAREFVGQEGILFIVGDNCLSMTGPLKDADDNPVVRIHFYAK